MRAVLDLVVPAVFPAACPGCGRVAEPICARCLATARPAPDGPPLPGLDALGSVFTYEGVVRELIARAKYRDRHAALPWLAMRMVETAAELGLEARGGARVVVTWAPTTPARRRTRGFDQAEVLARAIARRIDEPVLGTLVRSRDSAQTGRSRDERIAGVGFTPARAAAAPASALRGSTVLLVDDVVTTGATMRAAAGALRRAGAHAVVGLAAARRR